MIGHIQFTKQVPINSRRSESCQAVLQQKQYETRNQSQGKTGKSAKTRRLNNMVLNSKWVTEDTKGETEKY